MNLLLDTNIVIDYLGRKPPFFEDAERVVAVGFFGDATLWASAQSFKDAFYVLSHYVDPGRVQDAISKSLEVVNPVDLTGEDIASAARLEWDDFEDCLIALSASKAGADYLVTRDREGFARSMVPAISPGDLLDKLADENGVSYSAVDF